MSLTSVQHGSLGDVGVPEPEKELQWNLFLSWVGVDVDLLRQCIALIHGAKSVETLVDVFFEVIQVVWYCNPDEWENEKRGKEKKKNWRRGKRKVSYPSKSLF